MRSPTVLKLLFAPLRVALAVVEATLDLIYGPAPTGIAVAAVGPWAHVDEIPL